MILQKFSPHQSVRYKVQRKEREIKTMARIIEGQRRIIKMSVDDILNVVREYQKITHNACCYEHIRELLNRAEFYIPEDM